MAEPIRVVTDSMMGLKLPDYARLSPRVATVLGHNPGPFTGPGTNTYIVGTGPRPLLLDTGIGVPKWAELLPQGLRELSQTDQFDRVVITHAHQDHIGGMKDVTRLFGRLEVLKKPWPVAGPDDAAGVPLTPIDHDDVVATEGATLHGVFTPGHAPDHLCYYLAEEKAVWDGRYRSILDLEAHLTRNGTRVIKFFLHLSKEEQRRRFLSRIDEPEKNWKFSEADLAERKYWKDYMKAYEACIGATTTGHAPWYVVPADDKENARLIVSEIIIDHLESLKLGPPKVGGARLKELKSIRERLS